MRRSGSFNLYALGFDLHSEAPSILRRATAAFRGVDDSWDFTDEPRHRRVRGEYYQSLGASATHPAPLLQISPILGGALDDYLASRVFAGWAAKEGFCAFFLYQEEFVLAPERGGRELDESLLRSIVENVQALRLLASRPEIDRRKLGSFGISLGAIKNVLLAAAAPELKGNILCMGGASFADILRDSREGLVQRYFRERGAITGQSKQEIVEDIRRNLTDPLDVAPYVDPRRVILFLASLDDKVPYATGLNLYRALGCPELHVFPVGHYTAMVTAPLAARWGFDWLRRRFESFGEADVRP